MTGLPPAALLDALERGAGSSAPERALTLLATAANEDFGGSSPGERDAALLDVRRRTFGDEMNATATCSSCDEVLELTLRVPDLLVAPDRRPESETVVTVGDHEVTVRPPTAAEVAAAASCADAAEAEEELLTRVVIVARRGGEDVGALDLPPDVRAAIDEALAEIDPQGALEVRTECPVCGTEQRLAFDAASFVAAEVDWAALRLLTEVHDLATAYGWTERDVLALPAGRRRRYLDLVRA